MVDRCRYKDIFGKPREGVHSIRIFNIAVVDFGLTMLLAYIIQQVFKKYGKRYSYLLILLILLIIGTIIHKLMCVDTTITKIVFN
jgi:hypothetical protein